MSNAPDWKRFERGLLERLRYEYAPQGLRVEGTTEAGEHRVVGFHSGIPRQLDVAIYRAADTWPFFIADAKMYDHPLDVGDVDAFIGLMGDVCATVGLLAAPQGFSPGARRRARAAQVSVVIMSLQEALRYRWLPRAWEIYRWDPTFHHEIAAAIQALTENPVAWSVEDELEGVAFEEWDAFFADAMARHPESCANILSFIARNHHDEGWVFNASRILLEHDAMDADLYEALLLVPDRDLHELLNAFVRDK